MPGHSIVTAAAAVSGPLEQVVAKSDGSRRKLILAQLSDRAKQLGARGEIRRLPRLRNALLDILAEGRRKNIAHILVDVDIGFMVERESEGEPLPVFYIVRAAQRKSMQDIHEELQLAKTKPLGTD